MTKALTIGILECWTNRPEWMQHGDFADWFPPFLRKADPGLQFRVYHAHQGDLPENVTDCDAWLLTGSAASVYEDLPWQTDLAEFAVEAAKLHPVIGICYGHQLLHAALGGKVGQHDAWGIGVHRYDVVAQPGWTAHAPTGFRLLASHQDQVIQPARDSLIYAQSPFCPVAVTQIGDTVLTFQAHPEMTKALARDILPARRAEQGGADTDRAIESLSSDLDDLTAAHWIVDFITHVHATQSETFA